MPADVAMHTNFLHLDKKKYSNLDCSWNTENMSEQSYMTLQNPSGSDQVVQVIIYRTSVDHFAVIYPQQNTSRPLIVLNLKNTTTERIADNKFSVAHMVGDTPVALTFLLESPNNIEYWIHAFTARSNPLVHQTSLPVVEEEDI